MRAPRLRSALTGVSVALPLGMPVLPQECACCGQPATHRAAARRTDGLSVLIGYCDDCAEHQASASSRVLALSLSSLLLALVVAGGLPLLLPRLGLIGLVAGVCGASILPLFSLLVPEARPSAPHTARGAAAFWGPGERLVCADERYGRRVAELNGVADISEPRRAPSGSPWLSAGPLIGVGAACLAYFVYHPLLRIINLGAARVEIALDGSRLVSVEPTSNESASAGALLRVPAGHHLLSVSSAVDGTALGRLEVDFQSGAVHLYAVAADDSCFWLETTGYGQERRAQLSYQPLVSAQHFWVLPGGIDTWFAQNPAPSERSSQSSGGLLTALRQAPCPEAPVEVRPGP
jgi:hypothetical protein